MGGNSSQALFFEENYKSKFLDNLKWDMDFFTILTGIHAVLRPTWQSS